MSSNQDRIELKATKNGEVYFRGLTKNNKNIAKSETYKSKAMALKGISALASIIASGNIVDKTKKAKAPKKAAKAKKAA